MNTVSIIIPTYNRLNLLKKTLNCLFNQSYSQDLYEIIVIDDASQDNTSSYLQDISQQKNNLKFITHQQNCGPSKTRNDGINIAQGEIIIFLDDDMELDKDFIKQHIQFLENNSKTLQLVKIKLPREIQKQPFIKYLSKKGLYKLKEGVDLPWKDFTTGNVSMKKEYLDKYGGFDGDFSLINWEDQELGLKLIENGLHLRYNPKIEITHYYYPTLKKYCQKMEAGAANALLLYQKHPHDYVANFFRLHYLKPILSKDHKVAQITKAILLRLVFNSITAKLVQIAIIICETIKFQFLLFWLYGYLIGYHHLKGIKKEIKKMKIDKSNPLYKFTQ